jgi:putative DNA primase/helicase
MEESRRKREEDQAKRYAEAQAKGQAVLDAAQPASDHPYLASKVVQHYPGVKVGDWPQRNAQDCLLIPFGTLDGILTTVQAIAAQGTLVGASNKDWLVGGKKAGSCFVIGDPEASDVLILEEGYATCASTHEAKPLPVIMTGDSGNLLTVAKAARAKWPNKRLLIGADNDLDTAGNPGLKAAQEAARSVSGEVVIPDFTPDEIASWRQSHKGKAPTDFNDLRIIRGLAGVRALFEQALSIQQPVIRDDLLVRYDNNGNAGLVPHNVAAEILYQTVFNSLLYHDSITGEWLQYQGNGVFKVRPSLSIKATIYKAISAHCGDLGFSSGYESGVSQFIQREAVREPSTPPGLICLKNGVLELATRRLLPHSPRYFFTSQLPFAWEPNAPDPQPVMDWLRQTVGGHDDQVQLLRAWLHAVIVGRSDLQRFLELVGFAGSGKGSFMRLCIALVGRDAVHTTMLSALEANRFETAKLFGKKLVVITDAEKWHGDVSVLKSITGQDPIRFEEKNRQTGDSFTFGGMVMIAANQHTTSTDYSSGIQRRRITLHFDHVVPAEQRRDLEAEFEPYLPGVVRWALAMPVDEVTSYLRGTGSRVQSLREVRLETLSATNPIVAWLMECCRFDENAATQIGNKQELTITTGEEARVSRKEFAGANERLYPNYLAWCQGSGKNPTSLVSFSRNVIDAARNLLGKPYVSKDRQSGKGATVLKGILLKDSSSSLFVKSCEEYCEEQVIDYEECEGCEELKEFQNFVAMTYGDSEQDALDVLNKTIANSETHHATLHTLHIHNNQGVALHKPFTNPSQRRGSIADYPPSSPAGKVIHVLQGRPAGVSNDEIARQCGNGKELSPAIIQKELLSLSKAGLVSRINGNWVLQEVAA